MGRHLRGSPVFDGANGTVRTRPETSATMSQWAVELALPNAIGALTGNLPLRSINCEPSAEQAGGQARPRCTT